MKIKHKLLISPFLIVMVFQTSCKKLIEVDPPVTSVTGNNVYTSDATAIAVLTGIYTNMSASATGTAGSITSLSLFAGLSADELTLWSGVNSPQSSAYYTNSLTAGNGNGGYGPEFWLTLYPFVYSSNAAIEGLNSSSSLTPAVKQQLVGEAEFIRAFIYFYLVNLYGDLALTLSSNYKANAILARSPATQVYQQIIADLKDAESRLNTNYVDATLSNQTPERVRPTKWAAAALLARVYLYTDDWADAEAQADSVIGNSGLFQLSSLNNAFLDASQGNNEAIWQLQPVNFGSNTEDAKVFIIPSTGLGTGFNFGVYLSNNLLDSFETGDNRLSAWIGVYTDNTVTPAQNYYYPFKYKVDSIGAPVIESLMMLRLGEQYLIRAEARAWQGNTGGAAADLNAIRLRAGLGVTAASTQSALISAIGHERQVELFTELGQRWLDLKRTGNVDAVMTIATPQKSGGAVKWNTYQYLYPIPLGDIQNDPNLKQNAGYQ